jgi:hypothetical protein
MLQAGLQENGGSKSSTFWDKTQSSAFTPVSCLALTVKMKVTCSPETSVDLQRTTQLYISENRTLHNHRRENLKSHESRKQILFRGIFYGFVSSLIMQCRWWSYMSWEGFGRRRPWHDRGTIPIFVRRDFRLTDGGEVVSLTRRPPFTPQEDSWYSFLLEAESTPGP